MTENGGGLDSYRPEIPSSAGWATFEARVRGRRFARCIERAHAAIDSGALDVAQEAVNEARALMPDAPEISELESRIASQPSPAPVPVAVELAQMEADPGWPRVIGAMAVLLLLFGLFGFGLAQLYLTRPAQQLLTARSSALDDELSAVKDNPPASGTAAVDSPAPAAPSIADTAGVRPPTSAAAPPSQAAPTTGTAPRPAAPPARREIEEPEPRNRAAQKPRDTNPASRLGSSSTSTIRTPAAAPVPPPRTAPDPSTAAPAVPPPAPPPSTPRPAERTEASAAPVSALPSPPPAEPPAATVAEPVKPLDTPVPASRNSLSVGSRAEESARIRSVLTRYEAAYNRLDASAASSIWPGVDEAALNRAFKGLLSQRVSLGLCDITVIGDIGGASCVGKARWEPRVGGGVQTADRHWTFNLRKSGDSWRIEQIRVR